MATKRVENLVSQSKLTEFADAKQSLDSAAYRISDVQQQPEKIPMLSYGLIATRLSEAPPTSLVDVESHLENRYDLLGKSGYIYKENNANTHNELNTFYEPPVAPSPAKPYSESFFNQTAGRDYKPCAQDNFWRDDIIRTIRPVPDRYAHVDTRQMQKSKIDACTKP